MNKNTSYNDHFWIRLILFLIVTLILPPAPLQSCTVVITWDGDRVLVGNNEDWFDTNAKYWYEPKKENTKYGAVFFGFKKDGNYAQGGMNDQGLFFDGLYIDKVKLKKETRKGKKAAPQHVFKKMLHQASTVEEALSYLEPYFIPFIKSAQIVIADQNGDYAILNVNGMVRRRVEKEQFALISNFPAEQLLPTNYTDSSYYEAHKLLSESEPLDISIVTEVLDVCHQNGKVKSIYSNVFDLTNQTIDNYYLFDYSVAHQISITALNKESKHKKYFFRKLFPKRIEELEQVN